MIKLKDYILEQLTDREMVDYIITSLQDTDRLHKTYRFLTRMEFPHKEYNDYLSDRGLIKDAKPILRIFKDNDDDLDILLSIINDPEKANLPTSEDLLSTNDKNILNLFHNITGISMGTLMELADFTPPKKSVSRGRFEILSCLLLKDLLKNNNGGNKSSDVNAGTGADIKKLEYKADGGRIKGQSLDSPKVIDDKILSEISDYFDSNNEDDKKLLKIIAKGNIFSVKPRKKIVNIQTVLNDIIVKRMKQKFGTGKELNTKLQELLANSIICQFGTSVNVVELKTFFEQIWGEIFDNSNKRFYSDPFSRVFGVIDLYFYQKEDDWTHMVIFHAKENGKYMILPKENVQNLKQIWDNKNIKFSGFPEKGSPFGFAVHIHMI